MIIHMRKGRSCRWGAALFFSLELLLVSAAWFLVTFNSSFSWRFSLDDVFCVEFSVDDAGGGESGFSYSVFSFLVEHSGERGRKVRN